MSGLNSPRPGDLTMVGLSLAGLAAVALLSHLLGATDFLVERTCGVAPDRNAGSIDVFIAFLDCQRETETRYWMILSAAVGVGIGYTARTWMRREARRDSVRDKELDAEIERIRADNERTR